MLLQKNVPRKVWVLGNASSEKCTPKVRVSGNAFLEKRTPKV
jgi:hypothetical protein